MSVGITAPVPMSSISKSVQEHEVVAQVQGVCIRTWTEEFEASISRGKSHRRAPIAMSLRAMLAQTLQACTS